MPGDAGGGVPLRREVGSEKTTPPFWKLGQADSARASGAAGAPPPEKRGNAGGPLPRRTGGVQEVPP